MSDFFRNAVYELRAQEAEKQAIREAYENNDFERLNQFAARTVASGERPAGAAFKTVFDLLNGILPAMDKPLNFDNRLELIFYLKLLKDEFERVRAGAPSEWQDKKLVEIRAKQKEIEQVLSFEKKIEPKVQQYAVPAVEGSKPWMIPNPQDPAPKQDWYIPARFFARQLVKDDTTLLLKRDLLAQKIAKSLDKVGIKKRGNVKPFNPATIKKALIKVILD